MASPTADREAILHTIETWPVEDQIALAQDILRRSGANRGGSRGLPWRLLVGIASTGQQPPSDQDVAEWLDEHRLDKYG